MFVLFLRLGAELRRERRGVHLGVKLRWELVGALFREGAFVQNWMSTQSVGVWPTLITREARVRYCAAPGCPKCKRRAVMIVRGTKRLARRLLVANNP